jgi:hypothetical protein
MPTPATEKRYAKIRKLRADGVPAEVIGRRFGIKASSVRNVAPLGRPKYHGYVAPGYEEIEQISDEEAKMISRSGMSAEVEAEIDRKVQRVAREIREQAMGATRD